MPPAQGRSDNGRDPRGVPDGENAAGRDAARDCARRDGVPHETVRPAHVGDGASRRPGAWRLARRRDALWLAEGWIAGWGELDGKPHRERRPDAVAALHLHVAAETLEKLA